MSTSCGFCAHAGFDECFCGLHPEEVADSLGMSVEHYYLEEGTTIGRNEERARLRPLLEQCEALVRAQLHLNQRLRRPDPEAGALLGSILANLRRELGKEV